MLRQHGSRAILHGMTRHITRPGHGFRLSATGSAAGHAVFDAGWVATSGMAAMPRDVAEPLPDG